MPLEQLSKMTKGIIRVQNFNKTKNRDDSPIHLHIPQDAPIHLHFGNDSKSLKRSIESNTVKLKDGEVITYQAPWVPPPAKTSTGRTLGTGSTTAVRRVRPLAAKHHGSSTSLHFEHENETTDRPITPRRPVSGGGHAAMTEPTVAFEQAPPPPQTSQHFKTTEPRSRSSLARLAGDASWPTIPNCNLVNSEVNEAAHWTSSVVEQWLRDLKNSMAHVTRSVRNLEQCLEEAAFEGHRITNRDLAHLSQPRDDLVLHAGVGVRAAEELCRWAASTAEQQDRYLNRRMEQAQQRETNLHCEIRLLTEKLNRAMSDLTDAQQRLSEQQGESLKYNTVNESLESVKSHLQRELRQREGECNRLSVQLRNYESKLSEERGALRTRLEAAEAKVEQLIQTKEALKRAAKAQKRRADLAEQSLNETHQRLVTRDAMVSHLQQTRCDRNDSRGRQSHDKHETRSGSRLRRENSGSRDVSPVSARFSMPEQRIPLEEENAHLRQTATTCEQRLVGAEQEMQALRVSLVQCETMLREQHRDAESQADKLQQLTRQLLDAEDGRKRGQSQLDEIEQRLQDTESQNRALINSLDAESPRGPPSGRMTGSEAVTPASGYRGDEAYEIEIQRTQNPSGPMNTSLHTRHPQLSNQDDDLRRQLAEANHKREHAERNADVRLADMRAQLTQSDATNRSLQAYLTFLKRSYASVFQPDLGPMLGVGNATEVYTMSTRKSINGSADQVQETRLSPQGLPVMEKHRC